MTIKINVRNESEILVEVRKWLKSNMEKIGIMQTM